jgi:hypothetical protein
MALGVAFAATGRISVLKLSKPDRASKVNLSDKNLLMRRIIPPKVMLLVSIKGDTNASQGLKTSC